MPFLDDGCRCVCGASTFFWVVVDHRPIEFTTCIHFHYSALLELLRSFNFIMTLWILIVRQTRPGFPHKLSEMLPKKIIESVGERFLIFQCSKKTRVLIPLLICCEAKLINCELFREKTKPKKLFSASRCQVWEYRVFKAAVKVHPTFSRLETKFKGQKRPA